MILDQFLVLEQLIPSGKSARIMRLALTISPEVEFLWLMAFHDVKHILLMHLLKSQFLKWYYMVDWLIILGFCPTSFTHPSIINYCPMFLSSVEIIVELSFTFSSALFLFNSLKSSIIDDSSILNLSLYLLPHASSFCQKNTKDYVPIFPHISFFTGKVEP